MTALAATLRGPLRKRDSHLWSRDVNDWYVEPEWCSERLFETINFASEIIDPACGLGRIVFSARDAHHCAEGWDLVQRNVGMVVRDFLTWRDPIANIVSNPPFGIAEHFVSHALSLTRYKTCMLLPANWVQGDKRSRWLESTPLHSVLFITPRPSMPPGAAIMAGQKPGNGTTDYAWFIWERGYSGKPAIGWLRRDP